MRAPTEWINGVAELIQDPAVRVFARLVAEKLNGSAASVELSDSEAAALDAAADKLPGLQAQQTPAQRVAVGIGGCVRSDRAAAERRALLAANPTNRKGA